jgi:hypothetical protein
MEAVRALPDSQGESECTEKHLSNSELEKRKCFNSLFAGLEGLQELMTSYLYPVLYGHLNSSECRDYRWLYSSSLKSANTLTDRVVRRARSALQVIMVESVKMDLLKEENFNSVLDVGCESKKKRRNRRKKNSTVLESSSLRNSENEVVEDTTVLPQVRIIVGRISLVSSVYVFITEQTFWYLYFWSVGLQYKFIFFFPKVAFHLCWSFLWELFSRF